MINKDYVYLTRMASNKFAQLQQKLTNFSEILDELAGTSMVKRGHGEVKTCELEFSNLRNQIENIKIKIQNSTAAIEDVRRLLDRSDRTSNDYLKHLTEERSLIIEHRKLLNALEDVESQERSSFNRYSLAVRNFYEMERVQSDKMRFYSVCFSVVCTVLSLLGSTWLLKSREKRHREDLETIKSLAVTSDRFQEQIVDAFSEKLAETEKVVLNNIDAIKLMGKPTLTLIPNQIENQTLLYTLIKDERLIYGSLFFIGGVFSHIAIETISRLII